MVQRRGNGGASTPLAPRPRMRPARSRAKPRGADAPRPASEGTIRMTFGQLPYDVAHLLGGAMLLLSFVLLYQRRVMAVINAFAAQGAVLALAAAWQGWVQGAPQLYLTALIAFAAKTV